MKKIIVCFLFFFVLYALLVLLSNTSQASGNLVGYWKFDEGSGSTPSDSSGQNVSGAFSSTPPVWSTTVPPTDFANPYSLDFTKTGDGVSVAWPSELNFSSNAPRSFSFWYKPTGNGEVAAGNFDRIISWTNDAFEIAGTFGDVSVHRLAFFDGSWRDTGFNMSVGTWYNITFTYNGSNVILYVNNQQKYSGGSGGGALSGTMYIGTRHTGNEGINGLIDDVRVYNRALTPEEVAEISEGGSGPGVPTSTPTPTPTPSPLPTNTPTPTIVPTITPTPSLSSNSSTSSNSLSSSSSSSCADTKPSTPDLFQLTTSPTSGTVYFSPANPSTGYIVSYGPIGDVNRFSVSFDYANKSGAIPYTIYHLSPNTRYSFKVQAKNGCQTGDWSQTLSEVTTYSNTTLLTSKPNIAISPTPRGKIDVIEKKQTANQNPTTPSQEQSNNAKINGYDLQILVENDGRPIEGATVEVHSTPQRSKTDKNGIARFADVEKGAHTIYLSYQGFTGEEKINVDGTDKNVEIKMTIQMNPNRTYFSLSAIIVICILLITVAFLIFFFLKRGKNQSKKKANIILYK